MPFLECCNPFKLSPHKRVPQTTLLRVTSTFQANHNQFNWPDEDHIFLCKSCRAYIIHDVIPAEKRSKVHQLASATSSPVKKKQKIKNIDVESSDPEEPLQLKDNDYLPPDESKPSVETDLKTLNRVLEDVLRVSPIKKHVMRSKKSIIFKCAQIGEKSLAVAVGEKKVASATQSSVSLSDSRIIQRLVAKYHTVSDNKTRQQILTVAAAADMSTDQIAKEFNITKYMARAGIELYKKEGILSVPQYHFSHPADLEVDFEVRKFYCSNEISKMMPGMRDFVTVRKEDGSKSQHQKRLLLFNLETAHHLFLEQNPDVKVCFSKFARLRPPYVVFAGTAGTLTQCVCVIHANPDLMLEALQKLKLSEEIQPKTCTDFIFSSMCSPPSQHCNLGNCNACGGLEKVIEKLQSALNDMECDELKFSQWITQERCRLEVLLKNSDEFLELFETQLEKLKPHRFLVKTQHTFTNELMANLKVGEAIVLGDYAENYTFLLQNAVQANHWDNSQATLHIFVVIYRDQEEGELKYLNHVVVSEHHVHETKAVHLFQKMLFEHIKAKISVPITKVYYITDGCASQYKNKYNFLNLLFHKKDFNVEAQWHFHPTSHGKNLCDGIGGTIKRNAYRASHQRDSLNQIDGPKKLHEFIVKTMPNIVCDYTSVKDHIAENRKLTRRFKEAKPVTGCRSFHSFAPVNEKVLRTRVFSLSPEFKDFKLL